VLFKLPHDSYKVTAAILDQPNLGTHSATFSPPASGQKRVIIQFPKPPNQ